MQEVAIPQTVVQENPRPAVVTITSETVVYAALVVLALVLRFSQLNTVPLSTAEATQALSAWRWLHPQAGLLDPPSASPLVFMLQSISLALLGGSEWTARVLTVLGSIALILSPLLFRDRLGRARTLVLSLLLATSPVLLASSRESSGMVWASLLAVIGLWALYRFIDERAVAAEPLSTGASVDGSSPSRSYGMIAIVMLLSAALLADPGGIVLIVLLACAGAIAILTRPSPQKRDFQFEEESAESPTGAAPSEKFSFMDVVLALPWASALPIAVLVIVLIGTGFMTHTAGLTNIGELLGRFVRGFADSTPGTPVVYPLVVSLFYEPFLWVFALIAVIGGVITGRLNGVTRFMTGWVIAALFAALLFRGAAADHALWFVLPLAVLASESITGLFERDHPVMWDIPSWGRLVVALATLPILAVFTIALHDVARTMLQSADGSLNSVHPDSASLVLLLLPLVFLVMTFFLVSSTWSDRTALRGIALGVLIFGLVGSVGSGWRIAVENADHANELWHMETVSHDVYLLRETLNEVADRQAGGFNQMPIAAVAPPDGVIAWLLRDYPETQFVGTVSEVVGQPIILAPDVSISTLPADLTSAYAGEDFIIVRHWTPDNLLLTEFPAWWTQRRTRISDTQIDKYILWLRGDVYQGIDYTPAGGSTGAG